MHIFNPKLNTSSVSKRKGKKVYKRNHQRRTRSQESQYAAVIAERDMLFGGHGVSRHFPVTLPQSSLSNISLANLLSLYVFFLFIRVVKWNPIHLCFVLFLSNKKTKEKKKKINGKDLLVENKYLVKYTKKKGQEVLFGDISTSNKLFYY